VAIRNVLSEVKAQQPKNELPQRPGQKWQELWFACLRREWSSLVIVPAHAGGSAREVAVQLAAVAELHRGTPVKRIDAEGVELSQIAGLIVQISSHVADGGMVIVSVSSVFDNQAAIPLALAADAALLCVNYGQSDLSSAKKTLEAVGRERFIGSVNLDGR
jgi:hypothetical protein